MRFDILSPLVLSKPFVYGDESGVPEVTIFVRAFYGTGNVQASFNTLQVEADYSTIRVQAE